MSKVRLLLAEDHPELRQMIVTTLEAEFDVVGAVGDGQALLDAELRLSPDVCVLDISMPIMNGLETARSLRKRGSMTKIIFLTAHRDANFLKTAIESGAHGYVLKAAIVPDLHNAITEAFAGRFFISPSLKLTSSTGEVP